MKLPASTLCPPCFKFNILFVICSKARSSSADGGLSRGISITDLRLVNGAGVEAVDGVSGEDK